MLKSSSHLPPSLLFKVAERHANFSRDTRLCNMPFSLAIVFVDRTRQANASHWHARGHWFDSLRVQCFAEFESDLRSFKDNVRNNAVTQ